jgi:hypothetical protein
VYIYVYVYICIYVYVYIPHRAAGLTYGGSTGLYVCTYNVHVCIYHTQKNRAAGLAYGGKTGLAADTTASGPLFQQRPLPSPGS